MLRFVILFAVFGLTLGIIHRANEVMDEVIRGTVASLNDRILVEEFSYNSPLGDSVQCKEGAVTGFKTVSRKGYARIDGYGNRVWKLWAKMSINNFAFTFGECNVIYLNQVYSVNLSGRASDPTFYLAIKVNEGINCTAELTDFKFLNTGIEFNTAQNFQLLTNSRMLGNVTQIVRKDITDSINMYLYEESDKSFSSLKNCK